MPSSLDAQRVSVDHGPRTVLRQIDLAVHSHSRIGLIGPNGSGKSTLLRVLAGIDAPDAGRVTAGGSVGYLPQVTGAATTARELLRRRSGVADAAARLERHAARLTSGDLDAIDAHAEALERWLRLGGDDLEPRIAAAAAEVGLDDLLLDRPLATLSGGQAARVGLAAIRVSRHDVLLLDEPTNHLDRDGLRRLRSIVDEHRGGIVVVTHDRAFLDATVDELVVLGDVDQPAGTALHHRGDFASWERARDEQRRRARASHEQAVGVRDQLRAAEDETRRRATAAHRKTARGARGLPDGDKHNREWVRSRADGVQRRAKVIAGRAAAIEVPDKPWEPMPLRLELTASELRTGTAIRLEGVRVDRDDWTLGPVDLVLAYGDRVLLSGPNGSGKSTLLGVLHGRIAANAGGRTVAPGAIVAELGQARDRIAGGNGSTADAVRAITGQSVTDVRTALAAFGLSAEVVERPAATLSPGELTRAELAMLAATRTTCLLLDEPTNHLDVASLEAVEAALATWPGALVVASHDQRFRAALETNRTVELVNGRVRQE